MAIVLCPTQHFQGASHIAPDPETANRDLAVQLREIQTAINTDGIGVSVAVPQPLGVAAAGVAAGNANEDHVHAHGNQLGGTLHADAVAGVSSGFLSAAMATAVVGYADANIVAIPLALNMKAAGGTEVSAALNGSVALTFVPTHVILRVDGTAGGLNFDGTVDVGTSAGGSDFLSGAVTTGLDAVDACRVVQISGVVTKIKGNGTIYFSVNASETGAGTLTLDAIIVGRQV